MRGSALREASGSESLQVAPVRGRSGERMSPPLAKALVAATVDEAVQRIGTRPGGEVPSLRAAEVGWNETSGAGPGESLEEGSNSPRPYWERG